MDKGWISVHRKIQGHWLYKEKRKFSKFEAWVDLLLKANHKDNRFPLGNEIVECKRGQIITSIRQLCDRWNWSNTKIINFLKLLQEDKMIAYFSDRKKTVITIVNYNIYQGGNDAETYQKRQESDAKATQKHTNNNVNNDNNMLLSLYSEEKQESQSCPQACPQGYPQNTFPNFYKWVDEKGYTADAKYPNEEPYYLKYLHEKANFTSRAKGKDHVETIAAIKIFEDRKAIASEEDKEKAQGIS